ncbi:Ig-like domain-containing protein [Clostridium sp. YIM B02515]|uniref:Ig-like domain-containing protein n=1 Tax=Clostridium rhizosphaerae TaxID=2803861 RepID=A0ABS1T9G6_9CLOT|nr:endo-alpha-N-acetylgalactosaminidase family protein [Clostridium rhizosphaerae]MBL4936001.1 Ig-like domain-containing protein [Clostridium rhizosphaerae]
MKRPRKKTSYKLKTFALISIFLFTQVIGTYVPFMSKLFQNVKALENVYVRDFNDGIVGSWTNFIGTGTLSVENGQIKIIRDTTKDNKYVIVDSNSPELLDAEAQCDFTLVNGTSRFGIILRGSSESSHLFIGYNDYGKWLIETSTAWKDDIAGPTLVANQKYTLKVKAVGNKITIWVDGDKIFDDVANLENMPTTAGKVGFRTWYDNKNILVDNLKYGAPGSIVDTPPAAKTIKSLDPVNISTIKGVKPSLPSEVTAVYDDGTNGQEKVTWDAIDPSKYSAVGSFAVEGAVQGTTLKAIANITVTAGEAVSIESDKLKVTIDNTFPRVNKYEYKASGAVMYGQDDVIKSVNINGVLYEPTVTFSKPAANKAVYSMNFASINVTMDAEVTVNNNVLALDIKNVKENGTTKVNTIEIPNQNLISVRSNQAGAALSGARMYTAVSGTGDTFINLNTNTAVDTAATGYMYAFLNTNQLSAGVWSNSVYDNPSGITARENGRIIKKTVSKDGYNSTGLWSGQWTYRAKEMTTTEPNPSVKIVITDDENKDGIVDWQDGAIAFRSIMNNPLGAEDVPNLVVQRISMNFGSQATNPFLKALDETKKVYLATDGLGQNVLLKGYASEGHDSAHPDYGIIGQRQGGAVDLKTLVDEGTKYNASFGVHINATESYPEAKAFNEELVNKNAPGWDWLDPSYYIDTRHDAASGNRLSRLEELKKQVPNLEYIYLDVWYGDGWNSRQVAKDINSMGWRLETEFPNAIEYDSTWSHWAVDYNYGSKDTKGVNSDIVQFIRNHQKDTWVARDPLLGGAEMCDYEGWQGRNNFDDMIKMTFNTDLPTKYLQHFPITKWTNNTINFENNVSVSNATGTRIITKDNREVLKGNSYLLPWDPKEETKLYHWNSEGGETTWTLPLSWNGLKDVKLYRLSDQGKSLVETLNVSDNKVTIKAEANVAYVIYKGEAAPQEDMKWGEGTPIKDPGFNSNSLSNWNVKGEGAAVVRNDRGQYELKVGKGNGVTLTQQLTGLSEGTYSASVYVQVDGKRRASIALKNSEGVESTNYTDDSIAGNYIAADSKSGTNMQRMRVLFDVHAGKTTADLSLKVEGGLDTVTFDDLRIVKTVRAPKPEGAYFYEDFENVDQGIYPFVKGPAGGINDPRTHLSELHAPYTQKGWNGKVIDDVIEGNWSLKAHTEASGLLYQTIPQTLRFEPGKSYRVSFKYEAAKSGDYSFILGNGQEVLSEKPFIAATEPQVFTKEFKAGANGESWIGVKCVNGSADMVIDDLKVEEIPDAADEPTEIVPVDLSTVPNSMIKATATSEETEGEDNSAAMAIDGDEGTIWHTKWDLSDKLPQSITLNFGADYEINKVTVLPRQSGANGLIKQYSLSVSTNGTDFTEIAKGTWDTNNTATRALIKTITFDKVKAKYVKLTALDGVNGWASAAEIAVYRDPAAIVSADKADGIKTIVGEAPKLSKTVKATLSDGNVVSLPVRWDAVPAEKYSKTGTFTVEGNVNGSGTKTTAEVTVIEPVSIEETNVKTLEGAEPKLPDKVNVVYNDGSKAEANVTWGTWGYIDPSIYAEAGKHEVTGTVEGIKLQAKAVVYVTENNAPVITIKNIKDKDIISGKIKPEISVADDHKIASTVITLNGQPYSNEEITKAGNYELKVVAEDEFGNKTEVTITFTVVDKSALASAVKDAQAKLDAAVVGTAEGQYTKDAKDELSKAIKAAEEIIDNKNASQDEIDSGTAALNKAISVFISKQLKVETKNEVNDASALVNLINTVADKSKIVVDITKNTAASKDVLNAIKGQDKLITFQKDGISWTINGKDLKENIDKDIDLSLKVVSNELKGKESKLINDLVGKETSIAPFSFTYDGKLPGKFTIKVFAGKDFAGKEVNVCRYYEDKNTYEVVDTCKVDADGYISYNADHCSDYFVVEKSVLDGSLKNNDNTNNNQNDTANKDNTTENKNATNNTNTASNEGKLPKTGSSVDMTSLIVFSVVIMLSGGLLCIRKRKTN